MAKGNATLLTSLIDELRRDHAVRTRLGIFYPVVLPPLVGRDPMTGGTLTITARRRIVFVADATLLDGVCPEPRTSPVEITERARARLLASAAETQHEFLTSHVFEAPTSELDLRDLGDAIVHELTQDGKSTVRGFGTFARKEQGRGASKRWSIEFTPGREFEESTTSVN